MDFLLKSLLFPWLGLFFPWLGIFSPIYIAGKSLMRGPLYGPSAARADGRRTKFDWREVRTMNSWSHLMQQHAAHGVRAQSSQLQTRPGLWPPAPEVKPKATSGVLSSCNRRGMPAVCKPHADAKKAIACKSRPGQAPFEPRSGSNDHSGRVAASHLPPVTNFLTGRVSWHPEPDGQISIYIYTHIYT